MKILESRSQVKQQAQETKDPVLSMLGLESSCGRANQATAYRTASFGRSAPSPFGAGWTLQWRTLRNQFGVESRATKERS